MNLDGGARDKSEKWPKLSRKKVKHEKNEVFEKFFAKNIASSKIMRTFASVIAETNE